jgi:guanylate kinase
MEVTLNLIMNALSHQRQTNPMSQQPITFQRRGLLMVISAPSGCGKSVVLHNLRQLEPSLVYSVSVTSRAPRGTEVDGQHYHFVTRERFQELIARDAFYEWAEVHGNLYGTRADTIEDALAQGKDVVLDIDVQGGLAVKRRSPEAVLVFLLPPSLEVLEERLRGRGEDAEEAMRLRLANAIKELPHWRDYDYALINEHLGETVIAVQQILSAERHRPNRLSLTEKVF